jgi:hypothetical protein
MLAEYTPINSTALTISLAEANKKNDFPFSPRVASRINLTMLSFTINLTLVDTEEEVYFKTLFFLIFSETFGIWKIL